MTANASSRETGRDALASLLSTALVGSGLPVEQVFNYMPKDFGQKTPTVVVFGYGPPRRERFGMGTDKYRTWFNYQISIFVADQTDDAWTRQDIEDRLDLIEKLIADVIADHRSNPPTWADLKHVNQQTPMLKGELGGVSYWLETILVSMEVYDA